MIQLKIKYPQSQESVTSTTLLATKSFRFPQNEAVGDAIKEIREKTGIGGRDFGLFIPISNSGEYAGKWLEKNKTLISYELSNLDEVEYRKKTKIMHYKLVDGSKKALMIDESKPVRFIASEIGKKLGLTTGAEEFSLRYPCKSIEEEKNPVWLNEEITLQEQKIDVDDLGEDDYLVFAKRYVFNDLDVDKNNPILLNMLYIESVRNIVCGIYPVTRADAIELATMQFQVVYGDHDSKKHKTGFMDKPRFLPVEFLKDSKIEKEILQEHSHISGMSQIDAKFTYVRLVRSLKTYGYTFFDVDISPSKSSKTKKKKHLHNLGVSKDRIVVLDPKMNEVKSLGIDEFPVFDGRNGKLMFQLKDGSRIIYYTPEAGSIADLISGYIGIYVQLKKNAARVAEESEDEDEFFYEEFDTEIETATVGGSTAAYLQSYDPQAFHVSGAQQSLTSISSNNGVDGLQQYSVTNLGQQQAKFERSLADKLKGEINNVNSAFIATRTLAHELGTQRGRWGKPGKLTEEEWRKQLTNHKSNLSSKVEQMLGSAKANRHGILRKDVDASAKEIAMETFNLVTAARNVATLDEEEAGLIDGATAITSAVANLMRLMNTISNNPNIPGADQQLISAEKTFQAALVALENVKTSALIDEATLGLMNECIEQIAFHTNALLVSAKEGLPSIANQETKTAANNSIGALEGTRHMYIGTLKELGKYILEPEILSQVQSLCASVESFSDDVTKYEGDMSDRNHAENMKYQNEKIKEAIQVLIASANTAEAKSIRGDIDFTTPTSELLANLASLRAGLGEPKQIVEGTKLVATAHNDVIRVAKAVSSGADKETSDRLLKGAQNLSDALKNLISSARSLSQNTGDTFNKNKTMNYIGTIESSTQGLITDAGAATAIHNLRHFAKAVASHVMRLSTSAKVLQDDISDQNFKNAFYNNSDKIVITPLLEVLNKASKDPHNMAKQIELVRVAQQYIPSYEQLSASALDCVPSVSDDTKSMYLNDLAKNTQTCIQRLQKAAKDLSDIDGENMIIEALEELDNIFADLETAMFSANQGLLTAKGGITREEALKNINQELLNLLQKVQDLIAQSRAGQLQPQSIVQIAKQLNVLNKASQQIASTIPDRELQSKILEATKDVGVSVGDVISTTRVLNKNCEDEDRLEAVQVAEKSFLGSVALLKSCFQGLDSKEVSQAIEQIKKTVGQLKRSGEGKTYKDCSDNVISASKALSAATSQLLAIALNDPSVVGSATRMSGTTTSQLLNYIALASATSPDDQTANNLLNSARELADAMMKMLKSTRSIVSDFSSQNKEQLTKCAESVAQKIQNVNAALGDATSPEADEAIQIILSALSKLDNKKISGIQKERPVLLESFTEQYKEIAKYSSSVATTAPVSAAKMGFYAKQMAQVIEAVVDNSKSVEASSNTRRNYSAPGAKVLKGCEYIKLFCDEQTNNSIGVVQQINKLSQNIVQLAKRQAQMELDYAKKDALYDKSEVYVQAVNNLKKVIRVFKRNKRVKDKLIESCNEVIDALRGIEDKLIKKASRDENSIDSQTVKQILLGSRNVGVSATGLIRAASALTANKDSDSAKNQLNETFKSMQESIEEFTKSIIALNPGVKICAKLTNDMEGVTAAIDSALFNSSMGRLDRQNTTLVQNQQEFSEVAKEIAEGVKGIVTSAKQTDNSLYNYAQAFSETIPLFERLSITTAATLPDKNQQKELLDLAKQLSLNLSSLFGSIAGQNNQDINEISANAQQTLGQLLSKLQTTSAFLDDLEKIIKEVETLSDNLSSKSQNKTNQPYGKCRDSVVEYARDLAKHIGKYMSTDKGNVGTLGIVSQDINDTIPELVSAVQVASSNSKDRQASIDLVASTKQLLNNCLAMFNTTREVVNGRREKEKDLRQLGTSINTTIASIVDAAKRGAVGEILIESSLSEINNVIQDLNTAAIFSQVGQLDVEVEKDQTASYYESLLNKNVNDLLSTIQSIDKSIKSSDEDLGNASKEYSQILGNLAHVVKQTLTFLPDKSSQQDALAQAKVMAINSQQMVLTAKDYQRLDSNISKEAYLASVSSVKDDISRLIQGIQRNMNESSRGEKELEGNKNQILALIQNMPRDENATPNDAIDASRDVTQAVASLVFANTQDDIIQSGRNAFLSVQKLIRASNKSVDSAPSADVKNKIINASIEVANNMCDLLEVGKGNRQEVQTLSRLEKASGDVTKSITNFLNELTKLPDAVNVKLQEENAALEAKVDQSLANCLRILAENLKGIDPQKVKNVNNDEDLKQINTAIVTSSVAIGNATQKVVELSLNTHNERKEQRTRTKEVFDPTFANGLSNAADSVANAMKSLCDAAKYTMEGNFDEDAIVSSSQAVTAATSQLVNASRADPNSKNSQTLSQASKMVANATAELVKAAHRAAEIHESNAEDDLSEFGFGGSKAEELEAQMRILRLERELQREKNRMEKMARAQ